MIHFLLLICTAIIIAPTLILGLVFGKYDVGFSLGLIGSSALAAIYFVYTDNTKKVKRRDDKP